MKAVRKKIIYIIWSILYAYWILFITNTIFQLVDGHVLSATIWNMVMIIVIIAFEKAEELIAGKLKTKAEKRNLSIVEKILMYFFTGPSIKSALYFFYLVVVVYAAIRAADPDFPHLVNYDFLLSVRYGILILMAADGFVTRIFKDVKGEK